MRNNTTILGFAFSLFSIAAFSQSSTPPGRSSAHLFYFSPLESPVLIDGYAQMDGVPKQSEMWQWKNNAWQKINSAVADPRSLTAAAYNTDENELVVFGGIGITGYDDKKGDVHKFDGSKWVVVKSNDIGTRDHHEMVYANHLKAIVMFGGQNSRGELDTITWLLKDDQWKALNIAGPGKRAHHAMAYDPERKKVILYGGYDGSGRDGNHSDTWEFDGQKWTRVIEKSAPGVKTHHTMLYDPVRKSVLLCGGGDLWGWNGSTWTSLSNDGPDRMLSAVCFDPKRKKLVLFGGVEGRVLTSDTWEWDDKGWQQKLKGKGWKWNDVAKKYLLDTP
jgi:hypothetical protein